MPQDSLCASRPAAPRACNDLAKQNLPLVRRIAWHVHARVAASVELEELIQIGMIALVEAAQSYEDRGHAFSTYAARGADGAICDTTAADCGRNATDIGAKAAPRADGY